MSNSIILRSTINLDAIILKGFQVNSRKNDTPHSSGDLCRAILHNEEQKKLFPKADRCYFL